MSLPPLPESRRLPLFPLPLVLFPGSTLPLHVFEPRYRRMLADCLAGDRLIGILLLPEGAVESSLGSGSVGSSAHVDQVSRLPDGRSNITVSGRERFALRRVVPAAIPYLVGEVEVYSDQPDPADASDADTLAALAIDVRMLFGRIARAARLLTDDRTPPPDLPDDPAEIAFRIASIIDIDNGVRQTLLESRSPLDRLRRIERVLQGALDSLETRAALHEHAKSNGQGGGGGREHIDNDRVGARSARRLALGDRGPAQTSVAPQ